MYFCYGRAVSSAGLELLLDHGRNRAVAGPGGVSCLLRDEHQHYQVHYRAGPDTVTELPMAMIQSMRMMGVRSKPYAGFMDAMEDAKKKLEGCLVQGVLSIAWLGRRFVPREDYYFVPSASDERVDLMRCSNCSDCSNLAAVSCLQRTMTARAADRKVGAFRLRSLAVSRWPHSAPGYRGSPRISRTARHPAPSCPGALQISPSPTLAMILDPSTLPYPTFLTYALHYALH